MIDAMIWRYHGNKCIAGVGSVLTIFGRMARRERRKGSHLGHEAL